MISCPTRFQPASLDLRLGEVAYRVRASFLPGPNTTVAERIDELKLHEIALGDGAVLETNCVYIVPLIEGLALPDDVAAAANPKSSTGRLDVFTRVIADETRGFDRIKRGYHGPLYAEISPRTFPVLVREGSRLSQIRFRHDNALLDAEALRALHARERLVDDDDADVSEGIAVSVDLSGLGPDGLVGYRAKRHTGLIDVERRAGYDVTEFWEPMQARADRSLILDPDEFYILASKEAVQVPPDYAAEMVAVRSAGRRVPRALCRLLRSGLRLCRRRRARRARRAGSALARSALHPRARPDRRAAGLREDAGPAQVTLRRTHRLELPGAGAQAVEAFPDGIVRSPSARASMRAVTRHELEIHDAQIPSSTRRADAKRENWRGVNVTP